MQSVKIVEAVTKQTGTVIFLHVRSCIVSDNLTDSNSGRSGSRRRRNVVCAVRKGLAATTPAPPFRLPDCSDAPDHLELGIPHARVRPLHEYHEPRPADASISSWFDIKDLSRLTNSIHDDEAGMMRSVAAVESLIEKEVKERGIKEERIVIGGFSQGCVISILTALRTQRKVAGVISLSGWLPLSHKIEEVRPPYICLSIC